MSESNRYNEVELVRRAQAGDERAFESLVKSCDQRVMNIAYSMTGNRYDAEEVYQETFLRAYSALPRFQLQCAFSTWIVRIAVNQSITQRKKNKVRSFLHGMPRDFEFEESISDPPTTIDPTEELSSVELQQEILGNLDRLSSKERTVFTLKYFQEYKIREISEIMNCAEGTVKNLMFRATQKMKTLLKKYIED